MPRWRRPVGGACSVRTDVHACRSGICSWYYDGPTLIVEAFGPRLFGERSAGQKLARVAIQHIEEGVPVGMDEEMALATFPDIIDEDRRLLRIPIVRVVGR